MIDDRDGAIERNFDCSRRWKHRCRYIIHLTFLWARRFMHKFPTGSER